MVVASGRGAGVNLERRRGAAFLFTIYHLPFPTMRLFRRGKKKQSMEDKETAGGDWPEELGADETPEKIRVNDRRRFNLAAEEPDTSAPEETQQQPGPSLKPSYVEELEARARAAEQKS